MGLLDPRVIHKEHVHPRGAVYLKVAVVLFALTAFEVAAFEVSRRGSPPALAAVVGPFLIPILVVLSAAKFGLVAMFYMHLKQDAKIYSGLFVFPIIIAVVIVFALIALFSVVRLVG
ncbi:MAG: cytochrome C oxidase subunit IV [Gemmatimonadales bacterium]|nr:MAG: cytochrome C oxidase subunit IV [Gemmatimonadales bacterium]